jgi:diadenosine tetraphosphatase ApaH/serine/threonine PP2A family protein phosphatase
VSSVAALYDVHGNLPALDAVLAEVGAGEAIVFGGDVAAGAMPRETIERLMELGERARFVCGNADREMVEAFDEGGEGDDWPARAAARLERRHRDFLAAFEPTVSLDVDGLGQVLFCHGTPRSDLEIVTAISPQERLAEVLADVEERVVVCGHVHCQYDRRAAGRRIVNAGSVGLPYEGRPGAYWARLGPDVEHVRTAYDLDAALATLRATGFPDVDELVRESLLEPVSSEEVTRYFERQVG